MTVGYLDGVRSQPENLRRSAQTVRAALSGPAGAALTDRAQDGVLAFGMGASAHAAAGFAAVLRQRGVPALSASAADLDPPAGFGTAYLGISQSGRSTETVAALTAVTGDRLALTNDPDGPLARAADTVLPLGCGEDSAVSTLSYTATVQALGLIADHLTGRDPGSWDVLPRLAEEVLGADAGPLTDVLAGAECVDVVGSGEHVATAGAAALLLREAAHLPAAAFSTREYLHGPLETIGPGRAVLLFGSDRLAADFHGYGARVALVTDAPATPHGPAIVRLPTMDGLAGCALAVLPVQLAAHTLAERAGRPIELRYMPADTKLPAG